MDAFIFRKAPMIQLTLDTVPESEIHLSAYRLRIVRGARVTGLDMAAIGEAANALPACLAAPGMPQLFDAHPTRPAARVSDYVLRGLSFDSAEVGIVYHQESPFAGTATPAGRFRFRVGSSLSQEATQADKDGAPLLLAYAPAGSSAPATKQLATALKFEPLTTLTALGDLTHSPADLAKDFTGAVNRAPWRGGAARTWLCTGVEGEPADPSAADPDAGVYRTAFTFLYRKRTWDACCGYADPAGQPPPDLRPADLEAATSANGLLRARIYPEADFTQLPF